MTKRSLRAERLVIDEHRPDSAAISFCDEFVRGDGPRYVLGRNALAASVAAACRVDGIIDDYTDDAFFSERPVVRGEQVPPDALVVSTVIGRPLSAERRLSQLGLRNLDYFAFSRYSPAEVAPVRFWREFPGDVADNRDRYDRVFASLTDAESRDIFRRIVNFRLSHDLDYMRVFSDRQEHQYFEDFLALRRKGESFADVGAYDGQTTVEFIARCPHYDSVHVIEPVPANMARIRDRLGERPGIIFHPYGTAERQAVARFHDSGSTSRPGEDGEVVVELRPLDDLIRSRVTFMKMDIEGGEVAALRGASRTIADQGPRLAICVYHEVDDLWRVPELVFSMRAEYDLYLRHYTEGVDETVMFFIPREDGLA